MRKCKAWQEAWERRETNENEKKNNEWGGKKEKQDEECKINGREKVEPAAVKQHCMHNNSFAVIPKRAEQGGKEQDLSQH
jgi:hypothetical protein